MRGRRGAQGRRGLAWALGTALCAGRARAEDAEATLAEGALCDVEALPEACRGIVEVVQLLESSCQLCLEPFAGGRPPVYTPCREDDDRHLGDLALKVVMHMQIVRLGCKLGVMAAILLTVQYSASTRPFELEGWALELAGDEEFATQDGGFDLSPFPFWSDRRSFGQQLVFHSRYFAAHLFSCHPLGESEIWRGKYSLRAAQDKPEVHCAVRMSDYQLRNKCLARRTAGRDFGGVSFLADYSVGRGGSLGLLQPPRSPPGGQPAERPPVSSIQCPDAAAREAFARSRSERNPGKEMSDSHVFTKYAKRAQGGEGGRGLGCDDPEAEWRLDLRHFHKCILVVVMERLQLSPGARVLDWGSGCGHKLTWAAQFYGVEGMGVDIVPESVDWARDNSIGHFCAADGRFLSWLPEGYFDGVLSYAALAHLELEDQCEVVVELVGKLRIGGKMWFGWNAPEIWSNNTELEKKWMLPASEAWASCFATHAARDERWRSGELAATWEVVPENYLYPDDRDAIGIYLYLPPSYSLFVTRVRAGQDINDFP